MRRKVNENLVTQIIQKLDQNDQKCANFYTLANVQYVRGGGEEYNFL